MYSSSHRFGKPCKGFDAARRFNATSRIQPLLACLSIVKILSGVFSVFVKYLAQHSLTFLFVTFVWIGFPSTAQAQVEGPRMTWLQLRNQDVRPELIQLFKEMNVPFSIAPEVQGKVTLDLKTLTCATALQKVLHEVDATYRVQDGVYEVVPNQVDVILRNYGGKGESVVSNHLRFIDEDVRDSVGEILKAYGKAYTIAPEVQGRVTLDVENAPIDWVLKRLLSQVNATFRRQSGEYEIVHEEFASNASITTKPHGTADVDLARSSQAQTQDKVIKVIAFQKTDVREALSRLFREVGVPFWIAPDVQGSITLNLFKVPFGIALQNVLSQGNAASRVVAGIYEVVPRPVEINAPGTSENQNASIHVRFIREEARDAIRELFKASGKYCSISPDIAGKITMDFENATFEAALRWILWQVNSKCILKSGVYEIFPIELTPKSASKGLSSGITAANLEPSARDLIQNQNVQQVTFEQTDVHVALRQLFNQMHVPFSIATDVQGSVTLELRNVTFDIALQNVLRQVDAVSRVEAGVFVVVLRQVVSNYPGLNEQPSASNHFRFNNEDVRSAIRTIFDGIGKPFSIAPEIQGRITIDLDNASDELALRLILQQVSAPYRITGGVYEIGPVSHRKWSIRDRPTHN